MSASLDLGEDARFQRRFWRIQRIAWAAFALLIVAALLGLTGGGGPLSRSVVRTPDGLIDSPRISRWSAAEELRFELSGRDGARIDLSPDFATHFQLEDLQPAPDRVVASARGQSLFFETTGEGEITVVLHVTPENPGVARFTASLNGGAPRAVSSLILP